MTVVINGTSGITDVNGTAAAPAITGTDTDTGVFFGTNTVSLSTNGTERVTLDASGNLGIGNTAPLTKLVVGAAQTLPDSSTYVQLSGSVELCQSAAASYRAQFEVDSSAMYIGSNTYYSGGWQVYDSGRAPAQLQMVSTNLNSYISFFTSAANSGNGTERARIDSSGNLLVGNTNNSVASGGVIIRPAGDTYCGITNANNTLHVYSTTASAYRFYVTGGGTINATNTTITGISDQRLKENIRDLDDGLEKVMALQPRKFDWKEGKGADIKNARGFIAQEFETVFPDMIEEWLDSAPEGEAPYKAVNANLIPTLVKAIQEQQSIITQLQADVAALKGQA